MNKIKPNQEENDFLLERISEDVRELEQYIKEINTFLPLPVCLVSPNHSIIDSNKALKDFIGYEDVDIMGQKVNFLFANKRKAAYLIRSFGKSGKEIHKEIELLTKTQRRLPVKLSYAPRKDPGDKIIGYFLAFTDIRELKQLQGNLEIKVKARTKKLEKMQKVLLDMLDEVKEAKNKIETEQNRTAAIISNLIDPVIVVDNSKKILMFNIAAERVFKLSASDLGREVGTQKSVFSFAEFKDIAGVKFRAQVIETDKNKQPTVEEVVIKSDKPTTEHLSAFSVATAKYKKGECVYKVMTAPVCNSRNECYGYMKIFYDLTREKMIDQLKSEFISIAAHQLRTPLSAIKWAIKMTLDGDAGPLNEDQKKLLFKGYYSNERIINLVNDMLNVSRIEEGRFGYVYTKCKFSEVLREAMSTFDSEIKQKAISLTVNMPKKMPLMNIDKEKIELALQNVLENAVKYTPENGAITVNLELTKKQLKVKVIDNGVGIPEKNKDKLFTKFFRGENVVRMQTEGSGLGLFIAKNIINQHDGKLIINSKEGKGTEALITLKV